MRIVINDANILIDLADLNLLNDFIKLDFEFQTNDLIINEITNPEQKKKVNKIININKLLVSTVKSNEYKAILKLQSKNLSSPDCSILY
ncbi:MAG: hypothetical protein U9Q83_00280, partial [Bacteroidota bacterium]|nr:hypothetical protein [Bacteroidota bacterium]